MPTSTQRPRPGALARRPQSTGKAGQTGRFARPTARPSSRPSGRPTIVTRGRRKQQPSGLKGLAAALPGVGGKSAKASSGSGGKGKAGGLALLAGAAGLAFKNRGKLGAKLGRGQDQDTTTAIDATQHTPQSPIGTTTPPPITP